MSRIAENAEILLEEVPFRSGFIRSYINKPKGNGPFKTIYFLQGYPCQSVDWKNPQMPFIRLIHHWVDQGYAVVRVEKPGAGAYVNCEPCMDMTFEDELEGFASGYRRILELPYLDNNQIVLYGHSLGGIVAPYLASKFDPIGVITYGTVVRPWEDYVLDMVRYQQPILGRDFVDTEKAHRALKKMVTKVFRDGTGPDDWIHDANDQHLLNEFLFLEKDGTILNRQLDFWRTLNQHNVTLDWSQVKGKVLSLYGTSDIHAINELDAKRIAAIVNSYHPGQAQFKLIEQADHGLVNIVNQQEWADLQKTGAYSKRYHAGINQMFLETVDEWLGTVFTQSKPVLATKDAKVQKYEK